jgi:hypothetical protein
LLAQPPAGVATHAHARRCVNAAAAHRAEAFNLLQRQQKLETMLAEVEGSKPPELLLETTEQMLARMKAKLQRA